MHYSKPAVECHRPNDILTTYDLLFFISLNYSEYYSYVYVYEHGHGHGDVI